MSRGYTYKRCAHGITGTRTTGRACRQDHGSWWWRAEGETDPITGKRQQPARGGYRTRDEAEEALSDYVTSRRSGTWADDKGITVADWLTRWLDESSDLEPKTLAGYRSHVKNILVPAIGRIRLRDLRRQHVEDMLKAAATPDPTAAPAPKSQNLQCAANRKDGERCTRMANRDDTRCAQHGGATPTSDRRRVGRVVEKREPRTLDGYRRTLRAALGVAVRRGLVATNVAEGKIDALPKVRRAQTKWWEPNEVEQFLTAVQGDRLAALFELAAFAGLRRGELLGLRWTDIDLTGATPGLVVHQTVSGLSGPWPCPDCDIEHVGRRIKGEGKSEASTGRWVPLVAGTVRELLAHQAAQGLERSEWGVAYGDHGLVFAEEDGAPLRPDWISKRFDVLADAGGLPRIRLHDMRHGAASLLLAAGVPVELVAMILGHASPAITRAVYAHVLRAPTAAGMAAAVALVRADERAHSVHSVDASDDSNMGGDEKN